MLVVFGWILVIALMIECLMLSKFCLSGSAASILWYAIRLILSHYSILDYSVYRIAGVRGSFKNSLLKIYVIIKKGEIINPKVLMITLWQAAMLVWVLYRVMY